MNVRNWLPVITVAPFVAIVMAQQFKIERLKREASEIRWNAIAEAELPKGCGNIYFVPQGPLPVGGAVCVQPGERVADPMAPTRFTQLFIKLQNETDPSLNGTYATRMAWPFVQVITADRDGKTVAP